MIDRNRYVLVFDIETQSIEETHVNVRDPHKRKPCDQISSPAFKQHFEVKYPERERSNVVGEAVLAGEQVEELLLWQSLCALALTFAVLARFAKDLFMRDRPGHACDGNREQQQQGELVEEWNGKLFDHRAHAGLVASLSV